MGNCFVLCRVSTASRIVAADVPPEQGKVVKGVKMDGKVLEFRAPALVKDVLLNLSDSAEKSSITAATTRRIKIVITKKQLQELMTNQVSVQNLLAVSELKIQPYNVVDPSPNWKTKLQVIPEAIEQ